MFYIEAMIDKFLWDDYKFYPDECKVAMAIVRIYARSIREKILSSTCPFCGKKFVSKKGLRVHLAKSVCRNAYKQLVNDLLDAYLIFRYKIMKRFGNSRYGGFYLDLPNVGKIKFLNKEKVAVWIEENSDVVVDAINRYRNFFE